MKKYFRSRNDRMLGGVIGGLAEYFGADSSLLRLLTVLAFFLTGFVPILLTYILAWIIVPEKPVDTESST